jgi:uncharacterized protein involved in exopolysaccharide biosynthesis
MQRWYPIVSQTLAISWRWRWALIGAAWAVCIAGWVGVAAIPDSYNSEARLYVDTDAVLTPLLHGLAVDTAMSSQLEVMQKTLLSRPNLEKVIGMTDLELEATNPGQHEALVNRLGLAIKVQSQDRNGWRTTSSRPCCRSSWKRRPGRTAPT